MHRVNQELTSWNDANASLHFTRTSSLKLKDRWPHMLFCVVCARQELVRVRLACCIGGYSASAQQTRPAAKEGYQQALPVHVVSIRLSTFGGTCECCPGDELKVRPGEAMLLRTFSRECHQQDSRRYRDLRVNADLSGKHWQSPQLLANPDALCPLSYRAGLE